MFSKESPPLQTVCSVTRPIEQTICHFVFLTLFLFFVILSSYIFVFLYLSIESPPLQTGCSLTRPIEQTQSGLFQSCKMSYLLHRAKLSNQILPHQKCVNCDKSNTRIEWNWDILLLQRTKDEKSIKYGWFKRQNLIKIGRIYPKTT